MASAIVSSIVKSPQFAPLVATLLASLGEAGVSALLALISQIGKPKAPATEPGVVVIPGVVTPIPTPPASTPGVVEVARRVARATLNVQKAEYPNDPGNLYEGDRAPMKLVRNSENFSRGSHLWLDITAFDQESEEWLGHSLIAADLDYRTAHRVYKDGQLVAFIQGEGGTPNNPSDWKQMIGAGVHFGQRAWKDSIGCNVRTTFDDEGTYEVEAEIGGVITNRLVIRVS